MKHSRIELLPGFDPGQQGMYGPQWAHTFLQLAQQAFDYNY